MSWDFVIFLYFHMENSFPLHTVFKIVKLVHDCGNPRLNYDWARVFWLSFWNNLKHVLFCAVGVIWAVVSSLSVWMAAKTWPTTAPTVTRSLADTTGCNRSRDCCVSAEGGACARSYIKHFYSILLYLIVKFLHIVVIIILMIFLKEPFTYILDNLIYT